MSAVLEYNNLKLITEAINFDISNWNLDQIVYNRKDYEVCVKLFSKYFVEIKEIFVHEAA